MGKRLTARFVNGVIAALITVAFIAHGILGSLSSLFGLPSSLAWLVWGAVVLAGAHVVASVVTSREQLNDVERPPSARKKRHLALKWATGIALALAAAAHILLPQSSALATWAIVVLCIALAAHVCVGSKSLLKDLNIDRSYKTVFRVVVCAIFAACAIAIIVGSL